MYIKIANNTSSPIILPFITDVFIDIETKNVKINPGDYQLIPKDMFQKHIEYNYRLQRIDYCLNIIKDYQLINKEAVQDILEKYNIEF